VSANDRGDARDYAFDRSHKAKIRKHITDTGVLGKEKGLSRTGDSETDGRFHDRLAFPCHVNAVEEVYHFDV
jgi:hypothetical protein